MTIMQSDILNYLYTRFPGCRYELCDDDKVKVVINPVGKRDNLSEDLNAFLDFILNKEIKSSLTQAIANEVEKARSRADWRTDYMTLNLIKQQEREDSRIETLISDIKSIMKKFSLPLSEAIDCLVITEDEKKKILKKMNKQ